MATLLGAAEQQQQRQTQSLAVLAQLATRSELALERLSVDASSIELQGQVQDPAQLERLQRGLNGVPGRSWQITTLRQSRPPHSGWHYALRLGASTGRQP